MPYPYDADDLAAIAALEATTVSRFTNPDTAYVEEFPDALTEVATVASAVADAAAAAEAAASSAASLTGTSTTSFTPALGSQALTTQAGKSWPIGTVLIVASAANPTTNYGHGTVTSYSGTSLSITFDKIGASPLSATDWNITLSGPTGDAGDDGATGATGAAGNKYTFNSATSGDPGSGKFLLDNATLASATQINISETDGDTNAVGSLLAALDNGTSTNKALLIFRTLVGTKGIAGFITSTLTDQGSYDTFSWTPVTSWGSPANNDVMYMVASIVGNVGATGSTGSTGAQGDPGATGAAGGAITIPYTFSTTTTDSDPGNGALRLNNATQNSATAIRLDLLDANGATWTTVIDALDDSTNTIKGQFRLFVASDSTKFLEGNVTAVDSSTGYRNVTVAITASSASNPFSNSDALMFCFTRAGDKGADGAGSGDVVGPGSATDNALARFDATTGKLLQNSTVSLWDSGPLAPVTTDTVALGSTSLMWSDLFLASGAVINYDNGDVTLTHSADTLTMAGGTLVLPSAGLQMGASVPFSDSAGTLTLQNVDALDATTEATIEAAIDTLANLVSIQGFTFTLTGNLVRSGAHSLTLTTTGTTSLTLPTSGTVATTADFTGRQSIPVPASSMIAATTNGPAASSTESTTNKVMIVGLDFDASTQEIAQFSLVMPAQWDEGTITFDVRWRHGSTATNFGVAWDLAAVAFADDDAMDTAFGTAVVVTDTGGTTNDHYTTAESSAVTVAGSPAAGETVYFRVRRAPANGADTLAIDATLLHVNIYINTNAGHD